MINHSNIMKSLTKLNKTIPSSSSLVFVLFFISCFIRPSESNTTPSTNFHTSISPASITTATENEEIQPFTDVPQNSPNPKSLSVGVTRNPIATATQIKMSNEETTSSSTLPSTMDASTVSSSSSFSAAAAGTSESGPSSASVENTSTGISVSSIDPLEIREPISNQPETDQENTDERPPASSTTTATTSETATVTAQTQTSATTIVTMNKTNDPLSMTTTHETLINDIHVEKKLDNGLYRIKLAEIITDQFNGGINQHLDSPNGNYISSLPSNNPGESDNIAAPASGGKINIIDLYPLKLEDFNPIIKNSNEKLIREKNIYFKNSSPTPSSTKWSHQPDELDDRNMFPNSLDINTPLNDEIPLSSSSRHHDSVNSIARNPSVNRQKGEITDFTGKLLQEKDGAITEIEKKFRFDDFEQSTTKSTPILSTTTSSSSSSSKSFGSNRRPRLMVNHQIGFIDRRVKKSFDFPLHHEASSRVGFSNTKFKTDNAKTIDAVENHLADAHPASHPEFSTTKFYNSKELYNEMLQRRKLSALHATATTTTDSPLGVTRGGEPATATTVATDGNLHSTTTQPIGSSSVVSTNPSAAEQATIGMSSSQSKVASKRVKIALQKSINVGNGPQVAIPIERETNTPKDTRPVLRTNEEKSSPSMPSPTPAPIPTLTSSTSPVSSTSNSSNKKIEIPSPSSSSSDVSLTPTPSNNKVSDARETPSLSSVSSALNSRIDPNPPSSTQMPFSTSSSDSQFGTSTTTTTTIVSTTTATAVVPTMASKSKPISRPRILSRLQEKINSLECDIQTLPSDSHIWRGNETHELMLPVVTPENCKNFNDCNPMLVSWEGDAEIQSGDVLLVEINDASLYPNYDVKMGSGHTTQVYQVTRSGHEHCDVTEGILLDITPLVVDGRKLVTLYDKDLTEGINLLIVVSELWGSQCIRLKVTMKSDNCGENADCSGKGICFSNDSMEGYECQCCGGFAGPHCEEIDACSPSPCTNNGICVDLSQGHEGNAYQCLCPYGYTGKNCQYESDPCNPAECMNGGSCVGNSSHFRCDCVPGYTGPLCQHNLNECESSPCVHGICVDQEDGFRCFCQPGFAGELCNFEYNECESNPCLNGAECIDQIGSFECRCSKGYIGSRCEIKVDFCANKPCPEGHRCIDHGDDFSCECPGGRNGPDCNQIPRTQCNVNPCTHGGTCWSSGDSFYCACRPGYTGTMCEDEFVVETVVSSSEFMVDDTSARNFNDKAFGSVVLKSPIELHNAYIAAGVLAAAIFIVAVVVTICHCKVNQTYRKFSTRSTSFFPILGFGRRGKSQKSHKHWLSGKAGSGPGSNSNCNGNPLKSGRGHVPGAGTNQYHSQSTTGLHQPPQQTHTRPFQRHLAMNLENDMYYTVDFSEHSQHSPLIQ